MTTNDANQTSPDNQISLLAYLAYKFGGQTETIATEALGYILSRSEAARNALRDMIGNGGVDVGRIARAQTEVPIEVEGKEARVDLIGFDATDAERALVEVKFWAGLTENQPNTYLKRLLQNTEPSALLFVAPESRLVTLWAELRRLANAGGFTLSNVPSAANPMSMAINGGSHCLMLRSWRALLGSMASRASVDGDSSAERSILELNGLCEQQDTGAFLPIREGEFGPEFPMRLRDLRRLVDEATERARSHGVVNTEGLNVTPRVEGYGRYLRVGSNAKGVWAQAWLGVDYPRWLGMEGRPLWLNFIDSKDMAIKDVQAKIGYRHIPIILPIGEEYDRVLEDAVEQLEWLALRICGEVDDDEWKGSWPGNAQPATP